MSTEPAAHLHYDGRPRCGARGARLFAINEANVTCGFCLNIVAGTHGIGNRLPDDESCGTPARYKWHLRHEGKPVRCRTCLRAEQRRNQDRPTRDRQNERRRQRYAAARAAGATAREASQRKDLRRAA